MVGTYCTNANVSAFMQVGDFGAGSTPTNTEVDEMINSNEDFIDKYTGHAWRIVTITNEYGDFPLRKTFQGNMGEIYLKHRTITALSSGTDKLEIFDGSTWVDWVATKTEGRADDFFLEPDRGVVWVRGGGVYQHKTSVRVTYRYGEGSVVNDIKKACVLLTASDILLSEDRGVLIPDTGTSQVPYQHRGDIWRKQAMELLDNHIQYGLASS